MHLWIYLFVYQMAKWAHCTFQPMSPRCTSEPAKYFPDTEMLKVKYELQK